MAAYKQKSGSPFLYDSNDNLVGIKQPDGTEKLFAFTDAAQQIAGSLEATSFKQDGVTLAAQKWVEVTVAHGDLAAEAHKNVLAGATGDSYKIRDIILVGGGTNFSAGGNRLLDLTDGTTVYTTIANADLEAAPAASLRWGNAKVPMLTGTSDVATAAGAALYFAYSGGTTDHDAGSIKFAVLLEKVA